MFRVSVGFLMFVAVTVDSSTIQPLISVAFAQSKGWQPAVSQPMRLGGGAVGGRDWDTATEIREANKSKEQVADLFEAFIEKVVRRRPLSKTPIAVRVRTSHNDLRRAWWRSRVRVPLQRQAGRAGVSLNSMISRALRHSHQIAVFGRIPAIRETGVTEAWGRYRPELFAEAKKERRNDPSNSFSQARGLSRGKFTDRAIEAGVRSRLLTGAEVVLSHRASRYRSNLTEYDPRRQGRHKTAVTLVQPLLRDGGIRHGRRIIRVAELDSQVAMDEFIRQAEQHLLEIVRAYWSIYRARAVFLQKEQLAHAAAQVISRLQARLGIDADPVQVSRARAAASSRTTDLLRARTAIKNAELRLLSLINDPAYDRRRAGELLPRDLPGHHAKRINERTLLRRALSDRPELRQAFAQFRAALVREGIAENEALPQLDLILEGTHHSGSNERLFVSRSDTGNKYGYTAGLRFSVPIGTDERRARYRRRRIETIQQEQQVRAAIETVALELDVSKNEMAVAEAELGARFTALAHAQQELETIQSRWSAGSRAESGLILLTELLDGQERLQRAEEAAVAAEAALAVANENLIRARGGYLDRHKISVVPENEFGDRKTYRLERMKN